MFRLRTFVPFLLAYAIMAPALVKLEHHHYISICKAKQEKHLHAYSGHCEACHFEYSVFFPAAHYDNPEKLQHHGIYTVVVPDNHITQQSGFSFQLRAPPAV